MADEDATCGELSLDEKLAELEHMCAEGAFADTLLAARVMLPTLPEQAAAPGKGGDVARGRVLRAIAEAHLGLGDAPAAVEPARLAVESLERAGEPSMPFLGLALHTRALALADAGKLDDVLPLLDRAARQLESCGAEHVADYCAVLLTMGEISIEVGEAEASLCLFGRVLEELRGMEPGSQDHARALNVLPGKAFLGLGGASGRLDRGAEARDYLERATEFLDAGYGAGHPLLVAALEHVLGLYRYLGDESAAAAAEEELAAAREALLAVEQALASDAGAQDSAPVGTPLDPDDEDFDTLDERVVHGRDTIPGD